MYGGLPAYAAFMDDVAPIMGKYNDRLEKVAQLATDMTDAEAATMAVLLDNTERVLDHYGRMKNLSDTTYSETVGPFKKHAMNIVSAVFTTMDLRRIISIQPLRQKIGALYFMRYLFANAKSPIGANDVMFAADTKPTRPELYMSGYGSQRVGHKDTMTASSAGESEAVALTFNTDHYTGALTYVPITEPDEFKIRITDNGTVKFLTFLAVNGALWDLQLNGSGTANGTLNPLTGALVINSATNVMTACSVAYIWQSEHAASSLIPRVTVSVSETEVKARRNQLLFEMSLDATFDYQNQFGGRDLNAEMEDAVVKEIQNELSFTILSDMYVNCTGGTTGFDINVGTVPDGLSFMDYLQESLFKPLSAASMALYKNLGRGKGNFIVAGANLIQICSMLPSSVWAPNASADERGPHFAGRLLGKYDVFHNPNYPDNAYIMGFKGRDWWEAPYYVGSYLPVMKSQFMMFPDMHGEEGFISMEARKFLFPSHVLRGTVTL